MLGEQHQLTESELGRRHFDLQSAASIAVRLAMACAVPHSGKSSRHDLRDVFHGLRRKRARQCRRRES